MLRGSVFRHCEKNYVVIRRSNLVKNSDLQNFFYYFFWIATSLRSSQSIVAWTGKCSLCHSRESGNPEKSINTENF
ncbi:MAG: hypothetical protein ACEY3D_02380 [Rickettsia sp.]|uniref:hypothetical protein n=1 Tax=Rickettsia sp. TaxID=789 RepID=UPI00397B9E40